MTEHEMNGLATSGKGLPNDPNNVPENGNGCERIENAAPPAPVAASAVDALRDALLAERQWHETKDGFLVAGGAAASNGARHDHLQRIAAIDAALAASPPSPNPVADNPAGDPVVNAPRVRELVWTRTKLHRKSVELVEASTPVGLYQVLGLDDGRYQARGPDGFIDPAGYPDEQTAINACAADYERRVLACLEPGQGWRSMDSAPKDGRALLLCCTTWPPAVMRGDAPPQKIGGYDPDTGHWHIHGASWTPTHWQPLPPPPAAEGSR